MVVYSQSLGELENNNCVKEDKIMMHDVNLEFSKERNTWNVFVDGEWIYESRSYEQAEKMFDTYFWEED